MIPVTKPFLPPFDEYQRMLSKLWETKWLTNNGDYVQLLEKELVKYLEVPSLHFVSNGTVALQLAIKALNITGEVITTPFSFVATTTAIIWERCKPIFVDIDPNTLCIDATKIEEAITENTTAILATHVYGIPCDVEKIDQIARKHNLKVIYDAAHAFGVKFKGKSILNYGDISTLSFHATKLFHTVEGGGIVNNSGKEIGENIKMLRNFGFKEGNCQSLGINAKNSEFHAAMGLCNLKYVNDIISKRKEISKIYTVNLPSFLKRPFFSMSFNYNYAYYPVIFESEVKLLSVKNILEQHDIETRRYFYPSLNKLPFVEQETICKHSESISKRVLCLPLYSDLNIEELKQIIFLIHRDLGWESSVNNDTNDKINKAVVYK